MGQNTLSKTDLTAKPQSPPVDVTRPGRPHAVLYEADLSVSAHDRVSSFIVAMLYLVGFIVFLLFLLWLTSRATTATAPIAVEYLDELVGGEQSIGSGRDFQEPGVEDVQDLATPDARELLTAVTDVASSAEASSDASAGDVSQGQGAGDRRKAGAGGNVSVPRWLRWEVRFTATSLTEYAQQLQSFNIELAAAGGGREQVDYATGLTSAKPSTRSASGSDEQRLYMSYRQGQLQEFDRQLLRKAGIPTEGRTLLQFYPPAVENKLAALELQAAKGRSLRDVRKTVFAVKKAGRGYSFEVIEQLYR